MSEKENRRDDLNLDFSVSVTPPRPAETYLKPLKSHLCSSKMKIISNNNDSLVGCTRGEMTVISVIVYVSPHVGRQIKPENIHYILSHSIPKMQGLHILKKKGELFAVYSMFLDIISKL